MNEENRKVNDVAKEILEMQWSMKSGEAVGPVDIPVGVWVCLGRQAAEFLASPFNILESERLSEMEKCTDM